MRWDAQQAGEGEPMADPQILAAGEKLLQRSLREPDLLLQPPVDPGAKGTEPCPHPARRQMAWLVLHAGAALV